MSSKRLSPTATLLRNSRLFSMPAPLPRPLNDFMGHIQANKTSDTSTLPYPIQQVIATTPSGLARGDWGLKRALPLRSTTNTGTPLFRINAVDTREHITDFESGSDLTMTLQKFQELGIPITQHPPRMKLSTPEARTSVFDPTLDNTDRGVAKRNNAGKPNTRWKFHGPWVAGMTEGDFQEYLQKKVKSRKAEFLAWLKEERLKSLKSTARHNATHDGKDVQDAEANVQFSEQDFVNYIQELRSDASLGQPITVKIAEFLDLPALPVLKLRAGSFTSEISAGADAPPPRTHPSAGLTYIQSDSFMENHPILGPQARRAPVEARVLVAENRGYGTDRAGKIGVAGVVVADPGRGPTGTSRIRSITESIEGEEHASNNERSRIGQEKAGVTLGVHTTGGNRIWVEPTAALIDSRGRIDLKVANPERLTVDVHTGNLTAPSYQQIPRSVRSMPQLDSQSERGGFGEELVDALEDKNWRSESRGARPFSFRT